MSIQKRIQQGFLRMPTSKQAILLASAGMMLSPLFPWFEFQKKAGPLTVWLGYEGPFFLTALIGSAMGAYLFYKLFTPLLGEAFFKGGEKCGPHAMIAGATQGVLLLFALSSYFHPLFLETSLTKSPGSGVFISGISSLIFVGAGWAAYRREKEGLDKTWMDFEMEEKQEETIEKPWTSLEEAYSTPMQEMPAQARPVFHHHSAKQDPASYEAPTPVFSHVPEPKPHQFRTESRFHQSVQKADPFEGVDPLTLDAKTRYKLMKQNERASNASTNYWG